MSLRKAKKGARCEALDSFPQLFALHIYLISLITMDHEQVANSNFCFFGFFLPGVFTFDSVSSSSSPRGLVFCNG